MAKKTKYYVVWVGHHPGVYDNWEDARQQICGFEGALHKSFATSEEAVEAFRAGSDNPGAFMRAFARRVGGRSLAQLSEAAMAQTRNYHTIPGIRLDAYATDGACSGNPGPMEYRAVRVADGSEVFRVGDKTPLTGTNNIAEYLAIIHLAALLRKVGDTTTPIYTDSKLVFSWLSRGKSKTTLERTEATAPVLDLLARADAWLAANGPIPNPILKWKTEEWGEIPADFGRKH